MAAAPFPAPFAPRARPVPWPRLAAPALLAVAVCALASFAKVAETDAGWHIALGRLILSGHFPRTNALSWSAPDQPWYPTSWLFDVVLAASADALPGALGVQLVTFAFAAAAAVLLTMACAEEGSALGSWMGPGAMLLLVPRIAARPHVASWAAMAAVLWLCLRGRGGGPRLRLIALALLVPAGNLHTGAIFAAFVLGAFSLEAFARDRRPLDLASCALAAPAAVLANPGGLSDLRYLVSNLHVDDVLPVIEFARPTFAQEPAFFVLLPALLGLSLARARREPALLGCTAVFGLLGFRGVRMVYEFELVAAPAAAAALALIASRASARTGALAAGLALLLFAASRQVPLAIDAQTLAPRWEEHALPVRAAAFLEREKVDGRGFNPFRDGGYLAYARPSVPVFLDGRVQAYPPQLYRELLAAETSGASFARDLRARGIEWALTLRADLALGGARRLDRPPASAEWALVYWDDVSEVLLRRDVPRFRAIISRLEYRHFAPVGSIVANVATLPAAEMPALESELARFSRTAPDDPFAALASCALASRRGQPEASERCAEAALLAPTPALRARVGEARALQPRQAAPAPP